MKFFVSKKVVVGFCLAMIVLTVLGVYSYWNNRETIRASRWVTYTIGVLYKLEKIRSTIISLESSQRGFVITKNYHFLYSNQKESAEALTQIEDVKNLTYDNEIQQRSIDSLSLLLRQKIDFNKVTVEVAKTNLDSAIARVSSLQGENLKKRMIEILNGMESREKNLVDLRSEQTQADLTLFNFSFSVLMLFVVVLIAATFYTINATLRAHLRTQVSLQKVSDELHDLYNNSPCGYFSVDASGTFIHMNQTLLDALGYKRSEVINHKKVPDIIVIDSEESYSKNFADFRKVGKVADLEVSLRSKDGDIIPFHLNSTALFDENNQFVLGRSSVFNITERKKAEAKTKEIAKELESFTYSVSHDLRAPLRSISGFVKILEEDYSRAIDEEGKRLLKVIERNALNMGQLIDDLLDFSRMNRKEMTEQDVNLDDMVNQIVADLLLQEKNRQINIKVEPLGFVAGDLSMLRQVWINLISNAIKYTRKTPTAEIEINSKEEGGRKVFFVRDNGVGFDMKYHHKLFGVFQRLHKAQDFEGTGVGLALVQRIVARHGGKIWADATPNKGATFLFFLTESRN